MLIVDDEPRNVELLEAVLESTGCRTRTALGGAEALAMYDAEPPDLVLLDLMMPGVSGFDVLERLRESRARRHVPVIVITAAGERDARLRAVDLGADEFLDKPVDRAILLRRAHVLLALKATAEALDQRHRELRLLHERQKELTAFLVHDLKNPLAVIHHGVAWLTSELEGTDGCVAAALDDISTSSRRLIDMVAEMLAVSRMEAEPEPSRQGMSMDDLLPALVKEHSYEARNRGVTLDVEMNQRIEIFADAAMLRRALDNLLENALRHTPTGGRIALAATIDQRCTHVAVSNTGHAIPASEHRRIFEKFRSAKGAYTRASVGLGLYFCRQVAEAHGGTIELTSTPQWPVRFTLRIPHFG